MALIKNHKVKWCSIHQPNTTFEPKWQVDVILTDEEFDEFQAKGYPVKVDKDGDKILAISRKTVKKNGSDARQPVCRMKGSTEPFTEEIGNGSVCNIQYAEYTWEWGRKKGVGLDFKGIQVVELVSYGQPDGAEFEELGDDDDGNFEDEPKPQKTDDFDDDIPF